MDWIVADLLAIRQGCLGRIRYILKDGLRYLPMYGFYLAQVRKYLKYCGRGAKDINKIITSIQNHFLPITQLYHPPVQDNFEINANL